MRNFVAVKKMARLVRKCCGAPLVSIVLGLCAALAPNPLESAIANGDSRTIYLYHSHSKESIAATFRSDGHYNSETLEKLNWFLRDWRNDEPTKMDPRLFDVLWEAYRASGRNGGPDDPIVVVSAYRCPSTNAMLRRRSRAVAEHSQHMLGKAMDTTMPGLSMEKLREIAMKMQRGGVGYYPTAGTPFVHLDVGGVRHWPRMSYDQLARLFPDGKTVHLPSNGKPLPGYEEARAEVLARGGEAVTVAEATSGGGGGGIKGFFASLFGGGEEEGEARELAPVARPTRSGSGGTVVASADDGESGDAANPAARRMVASAAADLPRGETYLVPAPAAVEPRRQTVEERPATPTRLDEPLAEKPEPPAAVADLPLPPRRPDMLASLADIPLPPRRPLELAALPDLIAHGRRLDSRPGAVEPALAYAPAVSENPPLPPPRPAPAPLRAAAFGKAEETRVAKAVAAQMAPARADRVALTAAIAAKAPNTHRTASFAPPLRAAVKFDVLAAAQTTPGRTNHFGAKATQPNADGFSKKNR